MDNLCCENADMKGALKASGVIYTKIKSLFPNMSK